MKKLLVIGLSCLIMLIASVALANDLEPGGTFTDDNGNTHEGAIEAIAAENITRGCNPPANTLYCPDEGVTRGQMAAFLVRAFGLTANTHSGFDDVPVSHTFHDDIGKLATAGITRGCNPPVNDLYCPDELVTRDQMAAFMVRALRLTVDTHPGFVDVPSSHTFHGDIGKLATAEITRGCNPPVNDRYCPDDVVQRDQMASFLARALKLPQTNPPPVFTFGAGTYTVEGQLPAGVYRNTNFTDGCYWERLSGFSGGIADIIANDFTHVGQIVEIKSSDAGFSATSRCGTWTNQLVSERQGNPSASLPPGTYLVGIELSPGIWRSNPPAGESCYWERRSGFGGELADIIANDFTDSTSIVEIQDSDAGFLAEDGCGTWTKIG